MAKLKIYLDTCCYARPFDDLSQETIKAEADAKMQIQSLIINESLALYSSYMLFYEINEIPFTSNRQHILDFVTTYASHYISENCLDKIEPLSIEIRGTGVRKKDSIHLACGIIADCDYFITTDKRLT
ncbi:MAG: hypothetical protein LBI54_10120, partial [Lachnospiraceae bacterium]|nr:hypothetical protein [Lachnospiraceae bacterium]